MFLDFCVAALLKFGFMIRGSNMIACRFGHPCYIMKRLLSFLSHAEYK